MFELFTGRARRVVVLAQEEAWMLNHNYIGTEHILLGLIHEGEGVAAKALESLGMSLEGIRHKVEEIIGKGQQAPNGHIPFTPRAKQVLELSLREARQLGHDYIGTEHILLGLIREGEGVAAQVLVKLGADLNRVRQQVIQLLSRYQGLAPAIGGSVVIPTEPSPILMASTSPVVGPSLSQDHDVVSRDLTQDARQGRLDPVVGREHEIDRIIQILSRRTRNNPVLIGEPGVGKTAIINALAQRILANTVPAALQNRPLYAVELRMEAEPGLRQILMDARQHDSDLLLFVEDIEHVFSADTPLATLIQYMIGNREVRLISTGSVAGFRRVLGGDQRLLSVLQDVPVVAPDAVAAFQMMKAARNRFEAYHRISITDSALMEAVRLGQRYIHDRCLPASAIDLIDEAGARIHSRTTSPDTFDLSERINQVRRDKESAIDAQDFERVARLRDNEKMLLGQRAQVEEEWKASAFDSLHEIDDSEIREVVEQMLKERIDSESAALTIPDQSSDVGVVLPSNDVWTMA